MYGSHNRTYGQSHIEGSNYLIIMSMAVATAIFCYQQYSELVHAQKTPIYTTRTNRTFISTSLGNTTATEFVLVSSTLPCSHVVSRSTVQLATRNRLHIYRGYAHSPRLMTASRNKENTAIANLLIQSSKVAEGRGK